ncbi:unnamed protein product [Lota lota]
MGDHLVTRAVASPWPRSPTWLPYNVWDPPVSPCSLSRISIVLVCPRGPGGRERSEACWLPYFTQTRRKGNRPQRVSGRLTSRGRQNSVLSESTEVRCVEKT